MSTRILVHENSLRDGMHPKQHQITLDEMVRVATALDTAGVPLIEVTHGDGLGGASINYGFPAHSDEAYLRAVVPKMKRARISALTLPGIGTVDEIRMAIDCGVTCIRVATHCTEADIGGQHLGITRDLGVEAVGFLMMAHMISPEDLAIQGKILEDFGAQVVYCTDSAGYLLPEDVIARIGALRRVLDPGTAIGFHGHHNLAMGVANSIAAVTAGATRIDSSCAGMGAGAGNTPTEVLLAVFERMGVETGIDLFAVMDVAQDLIFPMQETPVRIDRDSLTLGFAGVYSSFLLFAQRAGAKYGVSPRDILVEMGRMRTVGGQEDMIEDVAINMARKAGRDV
jgi:4-hydroxy-2-oxovalerate/4-hydroxy-2-oxohexanoate aldolase